MAISSRPAPHTSPPGHPFSREEISCTLDNWAIICVMCSALKGDGGQEDKERGQLAAEIRRPIQFLFNNNNDNKKNTFQLFKSLESEPRSGNQETKGDPAV